MILLDPAFVYKLLSTWLLSKLMQCYQNQGDWSYNLKTQLFILFIKRVIYDFKFI